jgi:hypothetical protein
VANLLGIQLTGGNRRARRLNRAQFDNVVSGGAAGFSLIRKFNSRLAYFAGDGDVPENGGSQPSPLIATIDPAENPPWEATSLGQIMPFQIAARGGVPPYVYDLEATFPDSLSTVTFNQQTGAGTIEFQDEEDVGFQLRVMDSVGTPFSFLAVVRWFGA